MSITPKNLVKHELIGLEVKIIESKNSLNEISGRVVDETYSTFIIDIKGKDKVMIKKDCIFLFILPDKKKVQVNGKVIIGRPEDRIKKKNVKW